MTLSKEQKSLAEERVKEAGLEGHIRVHLLDYRDIPAEFEKAFDAFVSIEMLEVSIFLFNPKEGRLMNDYQACRSETLQYIFQTCGLCSEIKRRYCCGHILYLPRIKVLRLSVRFYLNTFFRCFLIAAAERKTSCANTCGRTLAYPVRRR